MSYSYAAERPWLFTEEGQVCLIKARDAAFRLLDEAEAFIAFKPLRNLSYPDTWKAIAVLDRMVELGDIREVTDPDKVMAQRRVFVRVVRDA